MQSISLARNLENLYWERASFASVITACQDRSKNERFNIEAKQIVIVYNL